MTASHTVVKILTVDFEESHVKKRVKKGGSLPSMTMYIGASRDKFSKRKSCSRNFCATTEGKVRTHLAESTTNYFKFLIDIVPTNHYGQVNLHNF